MQIIKLTMVVVLVMVLSGCYDRSANTSTCNGDVTNGEILVFISGDNKVTIGDAEFSKSLLSTKYQSVKKSCESVTVVIQADKSAAHKTVFATIEKVKSLGYEIAN